MDKDWLDLLEGSLEAHRPVCLVSLAQVQGTAPRSAGASMLVDASGLLTGTIGGGRTEYLAIQTAKEYLREGKSGLAAYDLLGENEEVRGQVTVFFKSFSPTDRLYIFGAGHVGHKLSQLAKHLRFSVTMLDDRKGFLNPERFPHARLLAGDMIKNVSSLDFGPSTYLVVASRSHQSDEDLVYELLKKESAYVGMLGSRKKTEAILSHLKDRGIAQAHLDRLQAPIGLPLGGQHPEEVALSILAQLVKVRSSLTRG